MEFRYHGSLATSSSSLLRDLGIHDQGLQWAGKEVSEASEEKEPRRKGQPARVQITDIYLTFKTADTANISVESLFKQLSALAL